MLTATDHALERMRRRGISLHQVQQAFDRGMVVLLYTGARKVVYRDIRAIIKGTTVITAYRQSKRKRGKRKKTKHGRC